ncbi:MAG TPA: LemA family protein [Pseudomonadales bacterium]
MLTALGLCLAAVAGAAIWIYNRLVHDRNQVSNAWSDIDVQLVRRHDLVPQLVTAVKAYADYEQATLTAVTELRRRAEASDRLPEKAALEDAMETGLHRLIAVQESYPDLKADANFRQLQTALREVEDHLQYARRFYNGSVRTLNTRIESFPHLLIARPFGFLPAEFFEADDAARANVQVRLS